MYLGRRIAMLLLKLRYLGLVVDVIKHFGGNLGFPKIKKLNKVCSANWTIKMDYFYCFSLGGNLYFLDFLQKKFYNINSRTSNVATCLNFKWHAAPLQFFVSNYLKRKDVVFNNNKQ